MKFGLNGASSNANNKIKHVRLKAICHESIKHSFRVSFQYSIKEWGQHYMVPKIFDTRLNFFAKKPFSFSRHFSFFIFEPFGEINQQSSSLLTP